MTDRIWYRDMFAPVFMQRFTRYQNIEEMLHAAELDTAAIGTAQFHAQLRTQQWNAFVAKHTDFASWDAMLERAGIEHLRRNLGGQASEGDRR